MRPDDFLAKIFRGLKADEAVAIVNDDKGFLALKWNPAMPVPGQVYYAIATSRSTHPRVEIFEIRSNFPS
jgi:hypothetical protein